MELSFILNGKRRNCNVEAHMRLIDILRETFSMTSVKEGCSEGECGACTVIMNGEAVCSCIVPAFSVLDSEILTLEGLEENGELDEIQNAFIRNAAVQCGFCTPGMIMAAKALLMQNNNPTEKEIKTALAGNICRCTGFVPIVAAVKDAAQRMCGHEQR